MEKQTVPTFSEVENLARKQARFWAMVLGMDTNDLQQEAYIVYHRCACNFNSDRNCKFSSWFAQNLTYHFKNMANRRGDIAECTEDMHQTPSCERTSLFGLMLSRLSDEGREVVELAVNAPAELWALTKADRMTPSKTALRVLLSRRGWKHKKISTAFDEISSALQTMG